MGAGYAVVIAAAAMTHRHRIPWHGYEQALAQQAPAKAAAPEGDERRPAAFDAGFNVAPEVAVRTPQFWLM